MSTTNMSDFAAQLRRSQEAVETQVRDTLRLIALQVLQGVVFATRVKTGRARGNWQVALNSAPVTALINYDQNGGATFSAGQAVVNQASIDDVIWVVNNVRYIVYLELLDGMLSSTVRSVVASSGGNLRYDPYLGRLALG